MIFGDRLRSDLCRAEIIALAVGRYDLAAEVEKRLVEQPRSFAEGLVDGAIEYGVRAMGDYGNSNLTTTREGI